MAAGDQESVLANVTVEWNEDGWNAVVENVVETTCRPMMQRLADECNREAGLEGGGVETDEHGHRRKKDAKPGYMASTDGTKGLEKQDYRATCITATHSAMADNARHNRLVNNLFKVEGGAD